MKMLRGCQKKVYFMKNTGSAYFEEAYFILKNTSADHIEAGKNRDLAEEAERIIKEASSYFKGHAKRHSIIGRAAMFALGAASSSAMIGIIVLIISAV